VVILGWIPRREVCRRFCSCCIHGYDRLSVRGSKWDSIEGHRRSIKLALQYLDVRCLDVLYCDEEDVIVYDIYWNISNGVNDRQHILREINNYTVRRLFADGISPVFHGWTKNYSWGVHLYFQILAW